ncbi:tyrosine-type recombinase/integrase [Carboxylicivirga caseinilyticus]|uniref:tyrosine-type recombinase/integrase n=1 Tax=Carboxylicivirga caseinilyticus TaxID=3417572 RepID=UPI003D341979|nr:site-specific integrase [Marinilabiliaceae bacterium A049]
MKISLRKRKLKNGKTSLFLEYYKGYTKDENGKIKHNREFENLNLTIFDKPKTLTEKQDNKDTLTLAEKIKTKKQAEFDSGKYGFQSNSKINANFIEYFKQLTDERFESKGNHGNWDSCYKHLTNYFGIKLLFKDFTDEKIKAFKEYLDKEAITPQGKKLSPNTKLSYFAKVKAALNQAFEDRIIYDNPGKRVKGFPKAEVERPYLTHSEVQKLAKAECRIPSIKKAFLFACLTGLRYSDIEKLTWKEVRENEDELRIVFTQKKTDGLEYLYISQNARDLLGERGAPEEIVIPNLKYTAQTTNILMKWAYKAGIYKEFTFHSSRHTNAVLMLENGADIYTVSKRLGHKEIRTTEIYAKIVDQKNKEAANIIPTITL